MPKKIHITQDEHGFWLMSLEEPDGTLKLLAHHFTTPDHLIQQAREMAAEVTVQASLTSAKGPRRRKGEPEIVVITDPARKAVPADPAKWPADYKPPRPKKARD